MPSFNVRNPLTYNNSTLLYEQLSTEPIFTYVGERSRKENSFEGELENVVFSPPLLPRLSLGTRAHTYKLSVIDGIKFASCSDGDKSISGGLGAGVDAMTFLHSECWSHLYTNHFSKRNKPQKIEFVVPDSAFPGIGLEQRKKRYNYTVPKVKNLRELRSILLGCRCHRFLRVFNLKV